MARPFGTFKLSAEQLNQKIDEYFAYCDKNNKPYTIEGLAVYLDVTPQTLVNYGKEGYADNDYFDAITRARQRCIAYATERLYDKDGVQGAKFYLTNNASRMGALAYSDKVDCAISVTDDTADAESIRAEIRDYISSLSPQQRKALGIE